jgi:hypothetical protein
MMAGSPPTMAPVGQCPSTDCIPGANSATRSRVAAVVPAAPGQTVIANRAPVPGCSKATWYVSS